MVYSPGKHANKKVPMLQFNAGSLKTLFKVLNIFGFHQTSLCLNFLCNSKFVFPLLCLNRKLNFKKKDQNTHNRISYTV